MCKYGPVDMMASVVVVGCQLTGQHWIDGELAFAPAGKGGGQRERTVP